MGELDSTVIGGVLIFVFGQLASRFVLEPLAEWRKLRGDIAHALHFYANVYVGERLHTAEYGEEVVKHYRDLASQLWQRAHAIPFYGFFAVIRIVPRWIDLREAASGLIGPSNSVFERDIANVRARDDRRQEIRKALRLRG